MAPEPAIHHHPTSSIDFFDENSQRLGRLELFFLLGHLQIAFNGLQGPWLPILPATQNTLEIKDVRVIDADIRLNGKRIASSAFIPEFTANAYKITYNDDIVDPGTAGDSDWIDLINDQEISSALMQSIKWQSPVKSVDLLPNQKVQRTLPGSIDSVVFDDNLSIQLASGQPLPTLPLPKRSTISKSINDRPSMLLLHSGNSHKDYRTLWMLSFVAFILYLGILLKLSQMTSIRQAVKIPSEQSTTHQHTPPSSSPGSVPVTVSKSPSRTLTVSFPDPLIQSSPAVLKVSVPAAFSLADNRHIVFPSKLRNFQK